MTEDDILFEGNGYIRGVEAKLEAQARRIEHLHNDMKFMDGKNDELRALLESDRDTIDELRARIAELERQLASSIVSGNDAREQCLEHVYALSAAALRIAELEGDLARERSTVTCVPRGWK
jgi:predicted RNase H-like nuclease (RuvC/YqgF family)